MLGMAALSIDLGSLRAGAAQGQSVADLAALAAGNQLGSAGTNYLAACEDAIRYVNVNEPKMPSLDPVSFCTGVLGFSGTGGNVSTTTCSSGGTLAQATPKATSGSYTVELHFPVPDSEIQDSQGYSVITSADYGNPCERMRVLISEAKPAFFGSVLGYTGKTVVRSSTVVASPGGTELVPAFWLLDPTGCVALNVTGNSQVTAGSSTAAGIIQVDSDGTDCHGSQTTISAPSGTDLISATAPAGETPEILLYALHSAPSSSGTCGGSASAYNACDPSDVNNGRITPTPTSTSSRATRAPVDNRFNCTPGSQSSQTSATVTYLSLTLTETCTSLPSYVSLLESKVGGNGCSNSCAAPDGTFTKWTSVYGNSCSPASSITVPVGNWWIDCPSNKPLTVSTSIDFQGGNVVFDQGVKLTNGGTLTFNDNNPTSTLSSSCEYPTVTTPCIDNSSQGAAIVYFRNGGIDATNGGQLKAYHTSVIEYDGGISYSGTQTLPPVWTAPSDGPFGDCTASGCPPGELALWSDNSDSHLSYSLQGGTTMNISGVFFAAYASPFTLTGGGVWGQQSAQFVAEDVTVSGGGTLIVAPSTNNGVTIPGIAAHLIR